MQLHLANNYYFQEKLELCTYVANQTFESVVKKWLIFNFQDEQTGRGGRTYSAPPVKTENYYESKQTYFSYGLDKAFHLPEFQAKLFFTRHWEGGFFWDSLLNDCPHVGPSLNLLLLDILRDLEFMELL